MVLKKLKAESPLEVWGNIVTADRRGQEQIETKRIPGSGREAQGNHPSRQSVLTKYNGASHPVHHHNNSQYTSDKDTNPHLGRLKYM